MIGWWKIELSICIHGLFFQFNLIQSNLIDEFLSQGWSQSNLLDNLHKKIESSIHPYLSY